MTDRLELKARLAAGEQLIGTWQKTPSPIITELLAATSLDLVCLDAEHAPFGRLELDACVHAARSARLASLVRVSTDQPHHILQALDAGATGVQVPHVRTAEQAAAVVAAVHYGPDGRGYSGSTRAAGYSTVPMSRHREHSSEHTVVVAQIEDADAIDNAGAIAAVRGIDALFIGPVDLSVSMQADGPDDPRVSAAIERIAAAGLDSGTAVGIFATTTEQVEAFGRLGITLFLMQSDQTFLIAGAERLCESRRK